MNANDVLSFWFDTLSPADWWKKDTNLDKRIINEFQDYHNKAAAGEFASWRNEANGALAEIIILDQFSRNIFRDKPQSFAYDGMALVLSQTAIYNGLDKKLEPVRQAFLYLPFMHSESLAIHEDAKLLYQQPGLEYNYDFELQHAAIIERFGRYPHRNAILGRESTEEEINFLKEPNSSF